MDKEKQKTATEILNDVKYYEELLRMALRIQTEDVLKWQEKLAMIAIDDLPRVLDAAVKLREALLLTRGSAYDMGRYACGQKADDVLGETAWLEDTDG